MAITKLAPRTIHLAGPVVVVNDIPASAAITPGHLIELHDDAGVLKWRSNAAAAEITANAVALEQSELNKGIGLPGGVAGDAYAAGDLVKAGILAPGSVFNGIIPSGQDIQFAELLQSNADGTLKSATATTAAATLGRFQSLDAPGSVTVLTRLRVMIVH